MIWVMNFISYLNVITEIFPNYWLEIWWLTPIKKITGQHIFKILYTKMKMQEFPPNIHIKGTETVSNFFFKVLISFWKYDIVLNSLTLSLKYQYACIYSCNQCTSECFQTNVYIINILKQTLYHIVKLYLY